MHRVFNANLKYSSASLIFKSTVIDRFNTKYWYFGGSSLFIGPPCNQPQNNSTNAVNLKCCRTRQRICFFCSKRTLCVCLSMYLYRLPASVEAHIIANSVRWLPYQYALRRDHALILSIIYIVAECTGINLANKLLFISLLLAWYRAPLFTLLAGIWPVSRAVAANPAGLRVAR